MTFTSFTYVGFLALVWGLYWALGRRGAQNALLVLASYAFYAWWDWRFCGLMLASSLVDYGVGLGLARARGTAARRALVAASLAANLGLLGFFKYFDFFAESLGALLAAAGIPHQPHLLHLILPVGISFYTFQTLGYTLDVHAGKLAPARDLLSYMAYVSFFPQLVAGPIERATNLLPQFLAPRTFDAARARDGCRLILWGFVKKMVLADNLGVLADRVYAGADRNPGPLLLLGTLAFAFQIYCDFSAYSDIAIGTARLFGIRLMRNFAYPYFSQTPAEFWRRWHISLSTWFRDYVYIPLGGSRRGPARHRLNLLVTFLVSGLWHGAAWRFVAWGGIHAGGVLLSGLLVRGRGLTARDCPGGERLLPGARTAGRIVLTFAFSTLAWVYFRAADLAEGTCILGRIAADLLRPSAYTGVFAEVLRDHETYAVLAAVVVLVALEWLTRRHEHPLQLSWLPRPLRWVVYTLLLQLCLAWGAGQAGAFIYFQF